MSGFANSIIGGATKLIRAAIQSPNYLMGSLGWSINKDGSAEFNNVTVRGTITSGVFAGNDFLINSSGFFVYSGTPAHGNLIFSIAQTAGTDGFSNAYPAYVSMGLSTQVQVQLAATGSSAGQLLFNFNSASFTNAVVEGSTGSFAQLLLNGPGKTVTGHKDYVGIELNSSDGISSFANMTFIWNDTNNVAHNQMYIDGQGVHVPSTMSVPNGVIESSLNAWKTTFTTYTSVVAAADADLIVFVQQNATYRFEAVISYFSSTANCNLQYAFVPTGSGGNLNLVVTSQGGTFNYQGTLGTTQNLNNPVASTNYGANIVGYLTTGSVTQIQAYFNKINAGNMNINQGSHIKLTRIG
jgi:hypothetical protein